MNKSATTATVTLLCSDEDIAYTVHTNYCHTSNTSKQIQKRNVREWVVYEKNSDFDSRKSEISMIQLLPMTLIS